MATAFNVKVTCISVSSEVILMTNFHNVKYLDEHQSSK